MEDLGFAAVERWLAMLGVQTLAEWDVLIFLNRHAFSLFPADTVPSLAGYSSALSSAALNSLVRLGLIKRFRADFLQDLYTPTAPDEPARKTALDHLIYLAGDRTVRLALRERPAEPMGPPPSTRPSALVVGLCGSAGALQPLSEIFSQLSLDTGMAFVVVQHMLARRLSRFPEILSRVTAMPVAQIEEGMSIQPNRVFVIPPNSDLTLTGNLFHLAAPTLDRFRRHRSIDTFLISLANDRRSAAISVILSGMDNDGIMGTAAIKKGGGITMAQRVDTALETALPRNVIADGWVDFVESPQAIAQLLVQFSQP